MLLLLVLIPIFCMWGRAVDSSEDNRHKKTLGLPYVLEMKRAPPVFTPTRDGSHGTRDGLGWMAAGKTIPMSGGVITYSKFYTRLTVGTAPRPGDNMTTTGVTFDVHVDTGSSNTAIPAATCGLKCGAGAIHPDGYYNASASPTSRALPCTDSMCQNCIPTAVGSSQVPSLGHHHRNQNDRNTTDCMYGPPVCQGSQCAFTIPYDGSGVGLEGTTVQDRVCVGDGVCADDMYISQITDMSPHGWLSSRHPLDGSPSTGIVGLAFPHNSCTPNCQPTFLDMLVAKRVLQPKENMFGMCLTPRKGGFIDLGALNSSRFTAGTMRYTSIVREHWYNINIRQMKVNGTALDVPPFLYNINNVGRGSLVDSGTPVVLLSPYTMKVLTKFMNSPQFSTLKGVHDFFPGGPRVAHCLALTSDEVAAYPSMSFVISGTNGESDFEVTMQPQQYLVEQTNGTTEKTNRRCLGIAGVPSIGVILGDVIMQNYYISFDRYGGRLGFAPLIPGSC